MTWDEITNEETIVVQFPISSPSSSSNSYLATAKISNCFQEPGLCPSIVVTDSVTLHDNENFSTSEIKAQYKGGDLIQVWIFFTYNVTSCPFDAPEVSFTIDGYNPDEIFAATSDSFLSYSTDTQIYNLDTSEKKFTYSLTNVAQNKPLRFHGGFKLVDNNDVLGKVKFSITGAPKFNSSAEMIIPLVETFYISNSSNEQLEFTIILKPIEHYSSYSKSFAFQKSIPISYHLFFCDQEIATEIRQRGEFFPTCSMSSTRNDISFSFPNQDQDQDQYRGDVRSDTVELAIEGRFNGGYDSVTFTCVQALNKGDKASNEISIGSSRLKQYVDWKAVPTVYVDGIIHVFTEEPVTNALGFQFLANQVLQELIKAKAAPNLISLDYFSYILLPSIPQISSGEGLARRFQFFNTVATAWTATSSHYAFGIQYGSDSYYFGDYTITLPTFTIVLESNTAHVSEHKFVWLDADVDTVYETTQAVQQVNTCWSTQQCAANYYCVESTCTSWSLLSLDEQKIVKSRFTFRPMENDGFIAITSLAMLIPFIIACAF